MTKLKEVTPSKSYKVKQVNLFLVYSGVAKGGEDLLSCHCSVDCCESC
jgi:hypothetical protein